MIYRSECNLEGEGERGRDRRGFWRMRSSEVLAPVLFLFGRKIPAAFILVGVEFSLVHIPCVIRFSPYIDCHLFQ